jgi:hypothetical protein
MLRGGGGDGGAQAASVRTPANIAKSLRIVTSRIRAAPRRAAPQDDETVQLAQSSSW